MTGPTPADVHVPTAMGNGKKKRKPLARTLVDMYKSGGLYIARLVQNTAQLNQWADSLGLVGFSSTLFDPDLHVTIVHSETGVTWEDKTDTISAKPVRWATLGPDKALVLVLSSPELEARWQEAQDAGAESTYGGYIPHVTLFYLGAGYDSDEYRDGMYPPLPTFDIVLGPELSGDLDKNIFSKGLLDGSGVTDTGRPTGSLPPEPMTSEDIAAIAKAVATHMESPAGAEDGQVHIVKIDVEKRMVWGWASVVTKGGVPVVDIQDDIIEMDELEKAAWDFMESSRMGAERHTIMSVGTVVDSIVFSAPVQKALGIDLGKEGWFVGVHFDNDSTWDKVKKGELKMFSIGGAAERVDVGKMNTHHSPQNGEFSSGGAGGGAGGAGSKDKATALKFEGHAKTSSAQARRASDLTYISGGTKAEHRLAAEKHTQAADANRTAYDMHVISGASPRGNVSVLLGRANEHDRIAALHTAAAEHGTSTQPLGMKKAMFFNDITHSLFAE